MIKKIKILIIFLKVILLWILNIPLIILGWFLIPFFMISTKRVLNLRNEYIEVFKCKWFDYIYGNKNDGISGDDGYICGFKNTWIGKIPFISKSCLATYNWCAWRNWTENYTLNLGVNSNILSYTYSGKKEISDDINKQGWTYSKAVDIKGRVYPMFRYSKLLYGHRGILFTIGYKNFNINEVPKYYVYSMVFSFTFTKEFRGF